MSDAEISPEAVSAKGKANQQAQAAAAPLLVADLGWSNE